MTEQNIDKFSITMDNPNLALSTRIVINIPIGKYAEDKENGNAIMIGKMEEAKAVCINVLKQKILSRNNMLIKPRGPIKPTVA